MPVLEIRALPQPDPGRVGPALAATCLAIAREYGCEPHHVWATWVTLEPGHYVEGDRPATEQPGQTHPPIGRLLCFEGRDPDTIERVLLAMPSVSEERRRSLTNSARWRHGSGGSSRSVPCRRRPTSTSRSRPALPEPAGGEPGAFSRAAQDFAQTLKRGEDTAVAAMSGQADAHALVEALAASELAVETAVTVRDKVVEAYQEILRMPV